MFLNYKLEEERNTATRKSKIIKKSTKIFFDSLNLTKGFLLSSLSCRLWWFRGRLAGGWTWACSPCPASRSCCSSSPSLGSLCTQTKNVRMYTTMSESTQTMSDSPQTASDSTRDVNVSFFYDRTFRGFFPLKKTLFRFVFVWNTKKLQTFLSISISKKNVPQLLPNFFFVFQKSNLKRNVSLVKKKFTE